MTQRYKLGNAVFIYFETVDGINYYRWWKSYNRNFLDLNEPELLEMGAVPLPDEPETKPLPLPEEMSTANDVKALAKECCDMGATPLDQEAAVERVSKEKHQTGEAECECLCHARRSGECFGGCDCNNPEPKAEIEPLPFFDETSPSLRKRMVWNKLNEIISYLTKESHA